MKPAFWFRVIWWAGLLGGLTWLLYPRFSAIRGGEASVPDVILTLLWIALALAPIFAEMEFFGLKFKAHVDEIKKAVKEEADTVRSELRSAIDVRNQFSPNIVFPAPSSDAQLSELREMVRAELSAHIPKALPDVSSEWATLDDGVKIVFATRYNLEKEITRLVERDSLTTAVSIRRAPSMIQMIRALVESERIEPDIGLAMREVYAVCSHAVHGNAPNAEQLAFVQDVAPGILAKLRSINIRASVT